MSLRQLAEGEYDTAQKDREQVQFECSVHKENHRINDFLCPVAGPPQALQIEPLLLNVRAIEQARNMPQMYVPYLLDDLERFENENHIAKTIPPQQQTTRLPPKYTNVNPYKEYQFVVENPMHGIDNALEKAREYLSRSDISSAVLCFEAVVSRDSENADAWEILGVSQSENDMYAQGIAALNRSLDLRPHNRRVLMALAVCYTNENLLFLAVEMLTNWLQIHKKYKHLVPAATLETAAISSLTWKEKYQEVQYMFLQAVHMDAQTVDPELQEALGILYNISFEHNKAVECFQAALQVNPQNAKVWHRLGDNLSIVSRDLEAVEAYQKVLELDPGCIRARFYLAACYINLEEYRQAVKYLLTASNMQANIAASREFPIAIEYVQEYMWERIWDKLRMAISSAERDDLQSFVSE